MAGKKKTDNRDDQGQIYPMPEPEKNIAGDGKFQDQNAASFFKDTVHFHQSQTQVPDIADAERNGYGVKGIADKRQGLGMPFCKMILSFNRAASIFRLPMASIFSAMSTPCTMRT